MEWTRAEKTAKSTMQKVSRRALTLSLICGTLCWMIFGCRGKSPTLLPGFEESPADTLYEDSLMESADTLVLDELTEETPLPVSVDELFDDFIFSFDQSNRLQRSRIRFPFTIVEPDGQRRTVERRDWQHHYLFLHQDVCTAFWDNEAQMDLPLNTTIAHARLEHIYLHSRQVESYLFNRDTISGQWFLDEIQINSFDHSPMASFLEFYQRFATDSVFQRHHLSNPLRFSTTDEENDYAVIEGTIDAEQWTEFAPELPQDVLVCINYGQALNNPDRLLMQLRGISNGLQNVLRFQSENGRWRLTGFED